MYRAIDQYGQVIDVLAGPKRDLATTRQFFICALEHGLRPTEVATDQAPGALWHEAKGVVAMHRSREADPSRTTEKT